MKLFDTKRVNETADFIADLLKAIVDRNAMDGYLSRNIREACPTYRNGLTNGERLIATLHALNAVHREILVDLGSLEYDEEADFFWRHCA